MQYASAGIAHAWRTQRNVRIQGICAFGVVMLALILKVSSLQWALLLLAIGLVIMAELFNTAVEEIVNWVSPQFHERARKIKDVTAGATAIAALVAALIGMIIFAPHFLP